MNSDRPRRSSQPASTQKPVLENPNGLKRGNSLKERYPGDNSHRPLDIIRNDNKTAYRAHHLRKKNFQGADTIDRLDRTGFSYHHEGPFDAANFSRNRNEKYSPLAAVKDSNEEALRATPRENIIDALQRHRPIEGVAIVPPGMPDKFGRVYDYKEGADLMREPGADYRRWPGVVSVTTIHVTHLNTYNVQEYHPNDLKGKGEPSYTIEEALKNHKKYGDMGTEMRSRPRNKTVGATDMNGSTPVGTFDSDNHLGRSNTTGKSMGSALKKRLGSLRRRHKAGGVEA